MKIIDNLKDRWITWRTGKTRNRREWEAWRDSTVAWRAETIQGMFKNFRHVIEVDPEKFLVDDAISWVPTPAARQYFWPVRELTDACVWTTQRVFWDTWTNSWYINEIAGEDRVFVATNNEEDAVMIALRWA